ncbi:hypothetical protein ACFQ9X_30325 [Catenulispora yoronensis]
MASSETKVIRRPRQTTSSSWPAWNMPAGWLPWKSSAAVRSSVLM